MRWIHTSNYDGAKLRLWPDSGKLYVRPFMRLDNGQNIFQETVFFISAQLPSINNALTVTWRELFFKIENKFRGVNAAGVANSVILNRSCVILHQRLLLPLQVARNTAKNVNMFIFSADQLVAHRQATKQTALKVPRLSRQVNYFLRHGPKTDCFYHKADANTIYEMIEMQGVAM